MKALVLEPQNWQQQDINAVTRLLVRQVWLQAIPSTASQAAQTELVGSCDTRVCLLQMAHGCVAGWLEVS